MMEEPLVNQSYLLEKFSGKGGWTYVVIPEVLQNKHNPFGWVKVRGSIDHFELNNYKLMPMGNGRLFLPVKSAIRKEIGKQTGDYVHVILYADDTPINIPEELLSCLKDDPAAYKTFLSYTDGQQKEFIDWIYSAKTDEIRVERIVETMRKLGLKKRRKDK